MENVTRFRQLTIGANKTPAGVQGTPVLPTGPSLKPRELRLGNLLAVGLFDLSVIQLAGFHGTRSPDRAFSRGFVNHGFPRRARIRHRSHTER